MAKICAFAIAVAFFVSFSEGRPNYWLSGDGEDGGGCGVLVSERTGNSGMYGAGYQENTAVTELEGTGAGNAVSIPINLGNDAGFFVTTDAEGTFGGTASTVNGCSKFVYAESAAEVTWAPQSEGCFKLQVATSGGFGQVIKWSEITVKSDSSQTCSSPQSPTTEAPTAPSAAPKHHVAYACSFLLSSFLFMFLF